jgi:hypothetical protein
LHILIKLPLEYFIGLLTRLARIAIRNRKKLIVILLSNIKSYPASPGYPLKPGCPGVINNTGASSPDGPGLPGRPVLPSGP